MLTIDVEDEHLKERLASPPALGPFRERKLLQGSLECSAKRSLVFLPVSGFNVLAFQELFGELVGVEENGRRICVQVESYPARYDEGGSFAYRFDLRLLANAGSGLVRYPSISAEHEAFPDRYRKNKRSAAFNALILPRKTNQSENYNQTRRKAPQASPHKMVLIRMEPSNPPARIMPSDRFGSGERLLNYD